MGNRRHGNEYLLKLMSGPKFHQSLTVAGLYRCFHISCVTSDRLCVSNRENNLIWTNTTGVTLHCVKVLCKYDTDILTGNGLHTMNSKCELIYIESKFNIKKRLKIMKNNFYLSKEKNLYMKTAVCLLVPIQ